MIRPVTRGLFRILCDVDGCCEEITARAENGWDAYQGVKRVGWMVLIGQEDRCRDHAESFRNLTAKTGKKSMGRQGVR